MYSSSVDPRGPRFAAWVTSAVLAVVLVSGSGALLAAQTLVFLAGAVLGLRYAPYGVLFRTLVRPRLGPPREFEPEAPPRFAQAVGAGFGLAGTAGYLSGATAVGATATSLALAAAFLNAAFGLCLGCETYLILRRICS
jgi:hypothetical protein